MFVPDYFSDPYIQYLHQILEEIDRGALLVPRFQRPLIWEVGQQLELLRSVRDGIPFGSILVWRTSRDDISCYESFGNASFGHFKLPPPAEGSPRQYIMDGIQRLSTLYAALRGPTMGGEEDDPAVEFFFDLESEDFVTAGHNEQSPRMLPLRIILRSVSLVRFQRNLEGDKADRWIESTDHLAEAFRQYKVPVIPIVTEDLEMATQTFQLINRQGTRMSDLHMVHTLTYSADFDLLERIEDLKSEVFTSLGWGEIDEEWILSVCKVGLGLDISKANAKLLSGKLKEKPDTIDQAAISLERAIRFLHYRCGVLSPYMVPYAQQAILLAEAFRVNPEPDEDAERLLEAWFWLTTMGGAFAGISGHRLTLVAGDLRAMVRDRTMVRDGRAPWSFTRPFAYTSLPAKVDFRSVRIKGLALRLAARQKETGARTLTRQRNRSLLQLLPPNKALKLYSSPGNRVLVDSEEISSLRERALCKPRSLTESESEQHLISEQAGRYLAEGDFGSFVETRKADLEADERRFIDSHARRFGFDSIPAPSLVCLS